MLRDGSTGDWIGTFIGHKGAVWSARLSPDASLAVTGSADFSARVWDTFTGECLAELGHNHIVRAVALPGTEGGSRSRMCATGGMEKRLRIWDLERAAGKVNNDQNGASSNATTTRHTNGSTQESPSTEIGAGVHAGTIKSIVWTHHPSVLTTASDDKMIRYFDIRDPHRPIASHDVDGLIGSCELNEGIDGMNEGTLSVAAGKNVYFFDAGRPGTLVKHIKMDKEVASVAVSATSANGVGNRRFVTGTGGDTWVHVWDYDSESELGSSLFFFYLFVPPQTSRA